MSGIPVADEPEPELAKPIDFAALKRDGIPAIRWIAQPYLVDQELNLWIGDGFTAKSMLALDTAIGLASGTTILFGSPVARPYRVLFMDEDGGLAQTSRRVLQLAKGRGMWDDEGMWANLSVFTQAGFSLGSVKSIKNLEEHLDFYKPEVLILDALRAFHGYDENQSDAMAHLMRKVIRPLIAKHGLASIIMLHHTAKDTPGMRGKSATAASRGSTEIRNAPDITLHLVRIRDVPTVSMEKARNLSESDRPGPMSFRIKDLAGPDDGIVVEIVEDKDRLTKLGMAKAEIMAIFLANPSAEHTHATLEPMLAGAKSGKYSKATAFSALRAMVGVELFSRVAGGGRGKNTVLYRLL